MTLRDRVKVLANERGLSLPALEERLGFGNGTIVKWNNASPNAEKLERVADFFGVSTDFLLGRDPIQLQDDIPDENFIILSRNAKKLSPEKRKQLLDMARLMFKEEFKD